MNKTEKAPAFPALVKFSFRGVCVEGGLGLRTGNGEGVDGNFLKSGQGRK